MLLRIILHTSVQPQTAPAPSKHTDLIYSHLLPLLGFKSKARMQRNTSPRCSLSSCSVLPPPGRSLPRGWVKPLPVTAGCVFSLPLHLCRTSEGATCMVLRHRIAPQGRTIHPVPPAPRGPQYPCWAWAGGWAMNSEWEADSLVPQAYATKNPGFQLVGSLCVTAFVKAHLY